MGGARTEGRSGLLYGVMTAPFGLRCARALVIVVVLMAGASTIRLYRGNRVEVLVDALAGVVSQPLADPLTSEWVVVQGRGMATWLGGQLAKKLGVWAHADMLYPRNFVQRVIDAGLGRPPNPGYREHVLPWVVLQQLEALEKEPGFEAIGRYVADDPGQVRRFQLSTAIARCFDEYLSYRPDEILRWEQGAPSTEDEAELWQAQLWRRVRDVLGPEHIAARATEFVREAEALDPSLFPERVCVFGISSLPPIYLRVLAQLCHHTEVHLFVPSPCEGFWTEVTTEGSALESLEAGAAADWLHLDVNHPLLASLGHQGAAFSRLLDRELEAASCAPIEPAASMYRQPESDSVLEHLQRGLLRGHSLDDDRLSTEQRAGDHSIGVHACHSPMREVEVAFDQLIELLSAKDAPRPEDVVVMMPDVETYAPLVEAVFGVERTDVRHIPFHIADRSLRTEATVIDGLERLLEVMRGKLTATQALDLLRLGPVHRHFGLHADDLDLVTEWVRQAQIRWGVDAVHRQQHGALAEEQNTWRFGLKRLFLGYAMPTGETATFAGTMPYDEIEGADVLKLGRLDAFCEALFDKVKTASADRTVAEWQRWLTECVSTFFISDESTAWEHEKLLAIIAQLGEEAAGNFDGSIGLDVLRAWLAKTLDAGSESRRFFSGGVTFCGMVPMRSIPAEVVYLLGMNDKSFPRQTRRVDFDLMRRSTPRDGDRDRRDDDRYLFLEAILSARRRFICSYTGQSLKDDATVPPSVVVSELLDHLSAVHGEDGEPAFEVPATVREEDRAIHQVLPRLMVRHPLQPFSSRYLDGVDSRLFTYRPTPLYDMPLSGDSKLLFEAPLTCAHNPDEPVQVQDLIGFFNDPIGFLMKKRLRVAEGAEHVQLNDRLSLQLVQLEAYDVGARLLDWGGVETSTELSRLRASGRLPLGKIGEAYVSRLRRQVDTLREQSRAEREGHDAQAVSVKLSLPSGRQIHGAVSSIYGERLVQTQMANVSSKHRLGLWLRHLILSVAAPERVHGGSVLWGRQKDGVLSVRFGTVEPTAQAIRLLEGFLDLYERGLREPLLLFPSASEAYVRSFRRKGGSEQSGLKAARSRLAKDSSYLRWSPLLFGALDPLVGPPHPLGGRFEGPPFIHLAMTVFEPLLERLAKP